MTTAIRTEDLSKTFGQTKALVSLNLAVPQGEVIGYLGPNGAGKTTTIRLLLGLIRATSGRAEIFGIDAQANPVQAHRRLAARHVPPAAHHPVARWSWLSVRLGVGAWLVGLGALGAIVGILAFGRRDLVAE